MSEARVPAWTPSALLQLQASPAEAMLPAELSRGFRRCFAIHRRLSDQCRGAGREALPVEIQRIPRQREVARRFHDLPWRFLSFLPLSCSFQIIAYAMSWKPQLNDKILEISKL
jgi:hypothetical protein